MNKAVLNEHGVIPARVVLGKLNGFELQIRPRVNLARSDRSCVFGALAAVTHEELAQLYSNLEEGFGLKYLPEPVLAETLEGVFRPVLCYIAQHMGDSPASRDYVIQLAECVRAAGFPEWYAEFVESFGIEEIGDVGNRPDSTYRPDH